MTIAANQKRQLPQSKADRRFWYACWAIGGVYLLLLVLLLLADLLSTTLADYRQILTNPAIWHSAKLSLITSGISAILSLWVAIPLGYVMSRGSFRGHALIDALVDIPIVLPPVVVGLSLLILFNTPFFGASLEDALQNTLGLSVTYQVPAILLAQFVVVSAFAIRTMRVTFDQIGERDEQIAQTLGSNRFQAFVEVTLPQAMRGMVTALTLAWARALGEFGPILVFAGATKMRTEVLSTSIFLELSSGDLGAATALSVMMIGLAITVLTVIRWFGMREPEYL
ncbi:MAG: molybdenum ABC transporter permease [Blastopirellula sp.]|nr:MAG: molybdenum ABC transporter permease [Blastopirellula sp.]